MGESERGKVGMLEARVSVGPLISPATLLLIWSSRGGDASRLLKDAKAEAGLHPVCGVGGGGKKNYEGCRCQAGHMSQRLQSLLCMFENIQCEQ